MEIAILTIFPQMFEGFLNESIIKKAIEKQLVNITLHNFRDYGIPSGIRRQVDDYPFGGGAGMVMRIEPIVHCLEALEKSARFDEIIYLTPDGELFNQSMANELSLKKRIALICGRYKGIDQRIRDHFITREISIGDYVLTGGELPAAVVADAIIRLIPGVLGDESSALTDSFQGDILDAPVYTRPEDFRGLKVPDILLSGDHQKIDEWRHQQALEKTKKRRPGMM
ncbi:MAG TPA: tRNA (guanosine(37)-N1)-methyltransferase TrmD [Bacteroidia bacterium]|nr:tRNA (guanosine(37)-N1)-methyltransferase TrmD [Bacteroidia bacterium]HRS58580.1 tRNA (guanosine(37)-N1)-methyltransferase TrmD [Bacteroidia bacterium]HRU68423.1 tRNA (guanosine(37)-N1)-methyltransferase TrmD [Bacteroidia bacterium]